MTEQLTNVGYLEDDDVNQKGILVNPEINMNLPSVLFIYATWCGYCKQSLPDVQKFADENIGKVNVLAIQADDPRPTVKALSSRIKTTYPEFKGFPTFVKYSGAKPVKKQLQDRSVKGLEEFAFS